MKISTVMRGGELVVLLLLRETSLPAFFFWHVFEFSRIGDRLSALVDHIT